MKRLFIITGAAGHLGSTIIRTLYNDECDIRGIVMRGEARLFPERAEYLEGDVTDPASLEPAFAGCENYETAVIHTAGIISIGGVSYKALERVNVGGTRVVADACIKHGVRMVHLSSVHAIPEVKGIILTEASEFSPDLVDGDYAKTKAIASQLVLDKVKNEGLDAVILHPSGILGPYDRGGNLVVQMIKMYMAGKLPAGVTGGYDFVDVRDVARGCVAAARRGRRGQCYILSNRYVSVREMLDITRDIIGGRKLPCLSLKAADFFAPLIVFWSKLTGVRPIYTRYALETLHTNSSFSHAKADAELGYTVTDIKDTIADTVRWLRTAHP